MLYVPTVYTVGCGVGLELSLFTCPGTHTKQQGFAPGGVEVQASQADHRDVGISQRAGGITALTSRRWDGDPKIPHTHQVATVPEHLAL